MMNKWEILREFINIREKLDNISTDIALRSEDMEEVLEVVSKAIAAVEDAQKFCETEILE